MLASSIVFWLVLLLYHLAFSVMELHPVMALPIRVGDLGYRLVFVGFLAATALFYDRLSANINKLEVTSLLWRLFITGMGGVAVVMLVTFANRASYNLIAPGIHRYLQAVYFSLVLYGLVLFFLSAVFIFRRFILYPRTRNKIIAWRVFVGFLGLGLVFQAYPYAMGLAIPISYIPLVVLSLVLSANVRWISYLTFNQKLRALGLFALLGLVIATFLLAGSRLPVQLGLVLSEYMRLDFIYYIVIFTMSYTLVALLVLFFNLPTSSLFEKEGVEIVSFTKINQAIQSNLDFSEMINTLLDASLMASNARAGWVEMISVEGAEPEIRLQKRISYSEISDLSKGQGFTDRVLQDPKPLLIRNLRRQRKPRAVSSRYRSLLAVPIVSSSKAHGVVFVVSELTNAFEDEAVKSISSYAEQTGIALENAQLIKHSIEVERYQEQLKIARRMQNQLLPQEFPPSERMSFAARSENAQEVGGDYFDVVVPRPGVFRLAIGDVSGKGTTAAFYMAETKGVFHALAHLDLPPQRFVSLVNQALSECMQKGAFMTLTYLEIQEQSHQIQLLRAGHCPTFFFERASGQVRELREGAPGLGIIRNSSFVNYLPSVDSIIFEPGDILLLYTDGINEARNHQGEEYGYQRIKDNLQLHHDLEAQILADKIVQSVKEFAHSDLQDDYTVLVIKFR